MSVNREGLSDFARRYTEAWSSADPTRVADHYSVQGSLTINNGTPCVGRRAITEAARSFMVGFPDLALEMDALRLDGALPEYCWTLTGTNTGPGGTGQPVLNRRRPSHEPEGRDVTGALVRLRAGDGSALAE